MSTHPQIIEKEGKKEFVVIPYKEFLAIQVKLEDYNDLKDIREAKSESESEAGVPLTDLRDSLLES